MSKLYTVAEEFAHSITHGFGVIFSIIALTMSVAYSSMNGDTLQVVASSIYGASLIFMYSTSTLYHSVFHIETKSILKKLDHAAIYLLIAGSYTPYFLVSLRDNNLWGLFAFLWSVTILGVMFEFVHIKLLKKLSLALYLGMGWLAVVIVEPLMQKVEFNGMLLLLAGGLSYTFGVIFYIWNSLPYNHAIWHIFVLAGSALHFCSIFFYVLV